MIQKLDGFSQNLASGMSRRKAFWQLLTGAGALSGLALLTTQKASAALNTTDCTAACFSQAGLFYTDCLDDMLTGEDDEWADAPPKTFIDAFNICFPAQNLAYSDCLAFSEYVCKPKTCGQISYDVTPFDVEVTFATCV